MPVYYIPTGTTNLRTLFPAIDWNDVEQYQIAVLDSSSNDIAALPPVFVKDCDEDIRIKFLTALGAVDTLNFKLTDRYHETKSETYEKLPTNNPSDHQLGRSGGVANDYYSCTIVTDNPEAVDYFDEVLDSPLAWMETAVDGGSIIDVPIVITDKKTQKFSMDDRYEFQISVEFKLSRPKVIIRN